MNLSLDMQRRVVRPKLGSIIGGLLLAICLSGALASMPASAAPIVSPASGLADLTPTGSSITKADYVHIRGGRGFRRYGYRRNRGIGTGAAILGGLLLGTIIANSARARPRYSAWEACARDYRSFDWDSGTIITYGGREVLCPYLR